MGRHKRAAEIIARAREVLEELHPQDVDGFQFYLEEPAVPSMDALLAKFDMWRRWHECQAEEYERDDVDDEDAEDDAEGHR